MSKQRMYPGVLNKWGQEQLHHTIKMKKKQMYLLHMLQGIKWKNTEAVYQLTSI